MQREGSYKEILKIAYPLILSYASMTIMYFVDRLFLSWYSPASIAAVGAASVASFTITCFFLGVAVYTNTLVAQYFGANKGKECSISTWQGIIFCIVSFPLILIFVPLGPYIFKLAGHTDELIKLEVVYYSVLLYGGCLVPLGTAIASFFTGRGITIIPMIANIIGGVVNIILNYCLIFGKFGFPELGVLGAGIGTVVGMGTIAIILFFIFINKTNRINFNTLKSIGFDLEIFKKLIKYGVPAGIQFFLDIIAFSIFILVIGNLGKLELAITNIIIALDMLIFLPIIGLGIATSTLVGQYIGAGKPSVGTTVAYKSLIIGFAYCFLLGIILVLFPENVLLIFKSHDGDAVTFYKMLEYGKVLIKILLVFMIADASSIIFNYALKGAGDTHFTMWAQAILAFVFFIPSTLVSVIVYKNLTWAWIFATIYLSVTAITFFIRFKRGKWKEIKMIEKTSPKPVPVDTRIAK